MGLYLVILGLGCFLDKVLGAVAAQVASFDGLACLIALPAAVAMLSVGALWSRQRRTTGLPVG
jgi:hypothetical protein